MVGKGETKIFLRMASVEKHLTIYSICSIYLICPKMHISMLCARVHTVRPLSEYFTIILSPEYLGRCAFISSSMVLEHYASMGNIYVFSSNI